MSEKSDKIAKAVERCACGFEVTEFALGLSNIENKIGELRVYK